MYFYICIFYVFFEPAIFCNVYDLVFQHQSSALMVSWKPTAFNGGRKCWVRIRHTSRGLRSTVRRYRPTSHHEHTRFIQHLSRRCRACFILSFFAVRRLSPSHLGFFGLTVLCFSYLCGRLRQNHRPDSVVFVSCCVVLHTHEFHYFAAVCAKIIT